MHRQTDNPKNIIPPASSTGWVKTQKCAVTWTYTGAGPGICVRGAVPPFLLEVGSPLNQLRVMGERCKLPQGVWSTAPAENEFGAL